MPFFESFLCFERNGQSSFSSSLRLLWSEFAFVRSKCKDCEAAMRVLCMRRGAQRDLQMASMQYHRPSSSPSSSPAATTVVGFSSSYATTTTATAQQEELCNPRRRTAIHNEHGTRRRRGNKRGDGTMNHSEVSQQVQQMLHFIAQEAADKANEIALSAEEEFNIEKLQIVEAEKKKIRQEFERKEKQVDVRKKIEYSTQLNASRLRLLQAQDDLICKMKEGAEKQLQSVSSNGEKYCKLLEGLIVQGLMRLNESVVQLRCREEDLEIVQSAVQSARDTYARIQGVNPPQVSVDHNHFLPGGPKSEQNGSSCTGGVVLATKDGHIVLENTLNARLEVVFKQQLPEIRKRLFPSGGQAGA